MQATLSRLWETLRDEQFISTTNKLEGEKKEGLPTETF